jgi:light-regulated signal transduction histidine kinase (bacteriophytochrome)
MPLNAVEACAGEPIHQLGRIQPFGFLVAMDDTGRIAHVSDNAETWLGRPALSWLGRPAEEAWSDELVQAMQALAERSRQGNTVERLYGWTVRRGPRQGERLDLAVHHGSSGLIFEAEPAVHDEEDAMQALLHSHAAQMLTAPDLPALWQQAVTAVAAITGFDRVMLYRFAADGSGTVEAEALRPGIGSLRGLRFPASDIPLQARALYLRSPSRVICDAQDEGIALVGGGDAPLDLSMSVLRSVSPVHLRYLRNMGTAASMSVSLVVDGRLWGLIACHHLQPLRPSHRRRSAAELLGALCASGVARLEREAEQQAIAATLLNPSLAGRLFGAAASDDDSRMPALCELAGALQAQGALLLLREGHRAWGDTPPAAAWPALQQMLQQLPPNEVLVLDGMAARWPEAAAWLPQAAGLLALPVGTQPREWVLLFRREVLRDELWAGNPEKAIDTGAQGQPEPRRSFAAWRQQVRGQGEPWTPREHRLAERLRGALLEGLLVHREQRQVDELRRAGQQQRLLVRELNHRVRNLLGLINGLVWQSSRSAADVPQLRDTLQQRVQAMARAHTQVEQQRWHSAPLTALLLAELQAFGEPGQAQIDGPPVQLHPDAYFSLALVVHELATNARKYGALSSANGRVTVCWQQQGPQGDLVLTWREAGGPQVTGPTRRGFGSQVIESAVAHELGGTADVAYLPQGLQVRITVPARHLASDDGRAPSRPAPLLTASAAGLRAAPARVLLVEDDLVIALLGEAMLREIGCAEVVVAGSAGAAEAALDAASERFDAAVLDVNLGDHASDGVAGRLQQLGVPVVVASGYSDLDALPPPLRQAGAHIVKPYTRDELAAALSQAAAARAA